MSTSRYECALTTCQWSYSVPDFAAPTTIFGVDEAATQFMKQSAATEVAMREHFDSHTSEEWLREVMALREQVSAKTLCAACITDSRTCEVLGKPQLPIYPAVTVMNGLALCDVEGRHRVTSPAAGSSLLLPGQNGQMPPGMLN